MLTNMSLLISLGSIIQQLHLNGEKVLISMLRKSVTIYSPGNQDLYESFFSILLSNNIVPLITKFK